MRMASIKSIILSSIIAFVLFGCPSLSQHGRLKAGVFPNHNEDISNVISAVEKYRIDLEQDYRLSRFEIGINPILHFAGPWPEQSRSYNTEYRYIEMNLIGRVYLTETINIFAENKRYYISNPEVDCNCTYANQVGIEISW